MSSVLRFVHTENSRLGPRAAPALSSGDLASAAASSNQGDNGEASPRLSLALPVALRLGAGLL